MSEPSTSAPTPHPKGCRACHGTGYVPDPRSKAWRPPYVRCTHDWWHDDTGWDPRRDEPAGPDSPRVREIIERERARGRAQLAALHGEQPEPETSTLPGF